MEIGELVSSVATSVQKAQQVMEYKTIENFLEYFIDSNTDKTADLTSEKFCPKFRTIEIPDKPQTRSISVPMMSLANHTGLSLDAVRIKLAINSYVENNRLQVTCKGRSIVTIVERLNSLLNYLIHQRVSHGLYRRQILIFKA